jgi:predicted nucleic acid-binding protein
MTELVFVDTSAFFALLDRDDRHHREAVEIARQLENRNAWPFTTNYIVAEAHTLAVSRLGPQIAREWLRGFSLAVEQASEIDQTHARLTVLDYEDKTYSLTDAISFSVMQRLSVVRAFAFDRHFEQQGFEIEITGP